MRCLATTRVCIWRTGLFYLRGARALCIACLFRCWNSPIHEMSTMGAVLQAHPLNDRAPRPPTPISPPQPPQPPQPRVVGILALRAPTELPMSCLARSAQPAELPSLGTTRQALCRRWGTWDYTPMQQQGPTDTPVSLSSTHSFDPRALPPPFTLLVLREVICMLLSDICVPLCKHVVLLVLLTGFRCNPSPFSSFPHSTLSGNYLLHLTTQIGISLEVCSGRLASGSRSRHLPTVACG